MSWQSPLSAQFIDSDGSPLNESFGVRSRRLRPAAPDHSYLESLDDYEVAALANDPFTRKVESCKLCSQL